MISQKRYTRNGKFCIIHKWSDTPAHWNTSRGGQIPYCWAEVVLEDVKTGKRRECSNLDDHGFYSLYTGGRQAYLERFQPIESLKDALLSATHYSQGKFGTMKKKTYENIR
jgi:hypothetical protein